MPVRNQGFASLHTVEQATEILDKMISPWTKTESILTSEALHRKLAVDIIAPFDQPGFKRAAMDGYAIKVEDSYGASETNPRQLRISGTVEIGDTNPLTLKLGEAIRISTGAPLPLEADGVIKIENTELIGDKLEIYEAITNGKNIAREDEDVKKGELILKRNTLLQPWDIGMLESLAFKSVEVYTLPKIATISTGNELIASGEIPSRGQVVDSNRPAINAWITKMGGQILSSQQCVDDREVITDKILDIAPNVDLIVTTGGTSVGTKDYLAEIIQDIGDIYVHGIAIRPGKPVALGIIKHAKGTTPIIALPGYPLAAFLNFHLFVSRTLHKWTGYRSLLRDRETVILRDKIPSKVGVHDFVRLRKSNDGAKLIRITGAGILSSIVRADYLLEVPTTIEGYESGTEVEVYSLR